MQSFRLSAHRYWLGLTAGDMTSHHYGDVSMSVGHAYHAELDSGMD